MIDLRQLQKQIELWTNKNFGQVPPWQPLLGAVEELGELAHAHLKDAQDIRTNEDHDLAGQDAVADIVIYLIHYCCRRGWSFETLLEETWREVRKRDWTQNKETGAAPCNHHRITPDCPHCEVDSRKNSGD